MNHVLFAKMDQVFSKENKTLNNTGILEKILEKSGKSQGILSFRKSGNPDITHSYTTNQTLPCGLPMVILDQSCVSAST